MWDNVRSRELCIYTCTFSLQCCLQKMAAILLLFLLFPSGIESSSATGQCSSEEMRRTKINELLSARGCNDYACGGFKPIKEFNHCSKHQLCM